MTDMKNKRKLIAALGNLADNQADLVKQGEEGDPKPYLDLIEMIEGRTFDESKLTAAQLDALTIAREEVAEGLA